MKQAIMTGKSRSEFLLEFGGWLVILGLFIEVILAICFHGGEPWYEKWPLVTANIIIVAGVWSEIHFGGNVQAEANARVAEANARASLADEKAAETRERTAEIEKLTAWRHLTFEQITVLRDAILPIASSIDLLIEYQRDDPESYSFWREITLAISEAGVNKIRWNANSWLGSAFGIMVTGSPEFDASVIEEAFKTIGMPPLKAHIDLSSRYPNNEPAPNTYIFVGIKPPPPMHPVVRANPDDVSTRA